MERFGISPGGQGTELLCFCGVGALLGGIYDLLRLWRILTSPPARRVFWQDLLFFTLAAALTQLLALPVSSGRIRLFHLLAIGLGAFLYLETAGRLTLPLFRLIRRGWDGVCGWIRPLGAPIRSGWQKAGEKGVKILKKVWKKLKNLLHLPHKI